MVRIGICFLIIMLIVTLVSIPIGAEEITDTSNKVAVSADNALVVRKITFRGTDEESEDFLRTFIQTRVGAEISPDLLSKDLKSLYKGTGFLSEIAVDVQPAETDGLEVIYRLKESPQVESINIIGTEKLKYGKVKEGIVLKAGETYSDKRRWESERNILETYKEKGRTHPVQRLWRGYRKICRTVPERPSQRLRQGYEGLPDGYFPTGQPRSDTRLFSGPDELLRDAGAARESVPGRCKKLLPAAGLRLQQQIPASA